MKKLLLAITLLGLATQLYADEGMFATIGTLDKKASVSVGVQDGYFGAEVAFVDNATEFHTAGVALNAFFFPMSAKNDIAPYIGIGHYTQSVQTDHYEDTAIERIEKTDLLAGFTYKSVGVQISKVRGVSLKFLF